jgi:uncharacterized membrane protein
MRTRSRRGAICAWSLAAVPLLAGCAPQPGGRATEAEAAYTEAYRQVVEEHRALLTEETRALREELRLLHDERIAARRGRIALIAQRHESDGKHAYDTIALVNRCRFVVSVAVHYRDLDDRWITRGWWNVDPGVTVETDAMTRNAVLYFFAENQAEGRSWTGEGLDDSTMESVVDSRFDHLDGDRWAYDEAREVSFFRRHSGEKWGEHVESFDCPLEAPLPRTPSKVEASPPTDQPAPRSTPVEAPPA